MNSLLSNSHKYFFNSDPGDIIPPPVISFLDEFYVPRIIHAEIEHCNRPTPRRSVSHQHNLYHIIAVTKGGGEFLINGKHYRTISGQVYFIGPNQKHSLLNTRSESTHYSEITFDFATVSGETLNLAFGKMLATLFHSQCRLIVCQHLDNTLFDTILNSIDAIIRLWDSNNFTQRLNIPLELHRLLIFIYDNIFRKNTYRKQDHNAFQNIYNFIHEHYSENMTLNGLSQKVSLNPNYLSRRFKEIYNITPIQMLIQVRIEAAAVLLKTTADPLHIIAEKVGFNDHFYFSKQFKKIKGYPPGEFRKI